MREPMTPSISPSVPVAAAWSSTESSPRLSTRDSRPAHGPALPTTFTSPCRLSGRLSDQADRACGECLDLTCFFAEAVTLGLAVLLPRTAWSSTAFGA